MITWLAQGIADFLRRNGTIRSEELAYHIHAIEAFLTKVVLCFIIVVFVVALVLLGVLLKGG